MLRNGKFCEKKVMRSSRKQSPIDYYRETQIENVEYYKYLGSMITCNAK
jgi:hypothetical protein